MIQLKIHGCFFVFNLISTPPGNNIFPARTITTYSVDNDFSSLVGLAPSNIRMPHMIEGTAENFSKVTVDRVIVFINGSIGLHEAFHSHREPCHDVRCNEDLGPIRLDILVSDVIIL